MEVEFNWHHEIATIHRQRMAENIVLDKRFNIDHVTFKIAPTTLLTLEPTNVVALTKQTSTPTGTTRSGCQSTVWIAKMSANFIVASKIVPITLSWQTESSMERPALTIPSTNALTALAFRLDVTMNFTQPPSLTCVVFAKVATRLVKVIAAI